jgi:16S rRNA (uracil1498-N3)-methyltransferase
VSTAELLSRIADDTTLVLHESAAGVLSEKHVARADSITIVVGPEGGIADDELDALTAAGAVAVRLGPTILRASTAAAVALGALGVLTPRWS